MQATTLRNVSGIRQLAIGVAATGLLLAAGTAFAATVETEGDTITAIRDLVIGSKTYDVEFVMPEATAKTIYDDPPEFDFDNRNDAQAAMQAVVAVINSDGTIAGAGPNRTPIFRIGYELETLEIDVPILDPFSVRLVKVWEGVTDAEVSQGVWGIPIGEEGEQVPDAFPFLDDGTFADFTEVGSGGSGNSPPNADAGDPYEGTVGVPVKFDGSGSSDSDGDIASYGWSFGDDSSGTGKKPEHTYSEAGTFSVTLKVKDDNGTPASDSTTVRIGQGSEKPTADAGGPYEASLNVELKFDGRNSTDDGEITSFKWDFGDGASGNGKRPVHAYEETGTYTVSLQVTDDTGEKDKDTTEVTVAKGNKPPKADAGPSYEVAVGETLKFDGRDSTDPDGEITNFKWVYGDGDGGNGKRPEHSYDEAGTYTATLTVTDDEKAKDSDSATVVVSE